MGLPVFGPGLQGIARFFGPTGGYLVGYLIASFVVGYFVERMENRTPLRLFSAMLLGNGIFFLFGVPYLASFIGLSKAISLGVLPFLIGDVLKLFVGVKLLGFKNF